MLARARSKAGLERAPTQLKKGSEVERAHEGEFRLRAGRGHLKDVATNMGRFELRSRAGHSGSEKSADLAMDTPHSERNHHW
jgi:hypothetical protein